MDKYRILGIYHSGRKGTRWTKVNDEKYDDLESCEIWCDLDKINQFQTFRFYLKHHPNYEWWDLSCIICVWFNRIKDIYYIETINSIYCLEKID